MSLRRSPLDRVRGICLELPEAEERPFGGHTAPAFRVRDKFFVMTSEDGTSMTLKAPGRAGGPGRLGPGAILRAEVRRSQGVGRGAARPPAETDWDEMAELIAESYCLTAPKRLAAQVGSPPERPVSAPGRGR